ncbi:MAG: hypothetical protein H7839_22985, partial [Magnetococcus sp. YQC-5]
IENGSRTKPHQGGLGGGSPPPKVFRILRVQPLANRGKKLDYDSIGMSYLAKAMTFWNRHKSQIVHVRIGWILKDLS